MFCYNMPCGISCYMISLPLAIADCAELREYILELKGQYGESREVQLEAEEEEMGPRKQRR